MEEGNVVLAWTKIRGGYRIWVRDHATITIDVKTFDDDFETPLAKACMVHLNIMTPVFVFVDDPPPAKRFKTWCDPAWYYMSAGNGDISFFDMVIRQNEGEDTYDATRSLVDGLFTGGLCAQCATPLGLRNTAPLPGLVATGPDDGQYYHRGHYGTDPMIVSTAVVDLLTPAIHAWYDLRPIEKPRQLPWYK